MAAERQSRTGKARWVILLAAIGGAAGLCLIEPMRLVLPIRFLFKPLEIYRVGTFDYTMCMRVPLSRAEAASFVERQFRKEEALRRSVPIEQGLCPAKFWPRSFSSSALAYSETRWPNGMVEGSSGAVYEGGNFYFWSWTQ